MNRKQLITLIIVLAVLGGAGWLASKKKNRASQGPNDSSLSIGQQLLSDFPINEVAQIAVIQSTQQLTLAREAEIWTVKERGNYPANFGNISDMLRKVWEIKVTKPVSAPASRLPALELVDPDKGPKSGTQVEFKKGTGQTITTLLLGTQHMRESEGDSQFGGGSFPDGRYLMVDGDLKRIALVSDPLSSIATDPASWLSKDFFKVEKIKSIAVTGKEKSDSWKISRESESGTWALADPGPGESLDASKVTSANYLLSSPYFNDVLVDPDANVTGLDSPRRVVIETFGNFKYDLSIGDAQPGENYPLKVAVSADFPTARVPAEDEKEEDKARLDKEFSDKLKTQQEKLAKEKSLEKWTYTVSKWTVDFLLKNRSDLLAEEKKEETPESSAGLGPVLPPAPVVASPPVQAPPPVPVAPPVNPTIPPPISDDKSAPEPPAVPENPSTPPPAPAPSPEVKESTPEKSAPESAPAVPAPAPAPPSEGKEPAPEKPAPESAPAPGPDA